MFDFIAAHNANFDRAVLNACCQNAHLDPLPIPFLCTVQLARDVWNIRPTKLPNVCEFLDIPLEHHQALSDARSLRQNRDRSARQKERTVKEVLTSLASDLGFLNGSYLRLKIRFRQINSLRDLRQTTSSEFFSEVSS